MYSAVWGGGDTNVNQAPAETRTPDLIAGSRLNQQGSVAIQRCTEGRSGVAQAAAAQGLSLRTTFK